MIELFTTLEDAESMNAFELAERWADGQRWARRTTATGADVIPYELDELVTMATLTNWLNRWLPIHVHAAILAGATIAEVTAATGVDVTRLAARWEIWVRGQRRLRDTMEGTSGPTNAGVGVDQYEQVAAAFRAAGGLPEG